MNEGLESATAQRLLASTIPARLAFVGASGHPHVAPIWFLWQAGELIMCSGADAAKVRAIQAHPEIAVSIDSESPPYESLRVRGRATVELHDHVLPEYVDCARRYYGHDQGDRWIAMIGPMMEGMARISLRPEWVEVWDFRERFPDLFGD